MGVGMIIRAFSLRCCASPGHSPPSFLILRGAAPLSFSAPFDARNIKCIISSSEDFSRERCTATRMSNGGNSSLFFFFLILS